MAVSHRVIANTRWKADCQLNKLLGNYRRWSRLADKRESILSARGHLPAIYWHLTQTWKRRSCSQAATCSSVLLKGIAVELFGHSENFDYVQIIVFLVIATTLSWLPYRGNHHETSESMQAKPVSTLTHIFMRVRAELLKDKNEDIANNWPLFLLSQQCKRTKNRNSKTFTYLEE